MKSRRFARVSNLYLLISFRENFMFGGPPHWPLLSKPALVIFCEIFFEDLDTESGEAQLLTTGAVLVECLPPLLFHVSQSSINLLLNLGRQVQLLDRPEYLHVGRTLAPAELKQHRNCITWRFISILNKFSSYSRIRWQGITSLFFSIDTPANIEAFKLLSRSPIYDCLLTGGKYYGILSLLELTMFSNVLFLRIVFTESTKDR